MNAFKQTDQGNIEKDWSKSFSDVSKSSDIEEELIKINKHTETIQYGSS